MASRKHCRECGEVLSKDEVGLTKKLLDMEKIVLSQYFKALYADGQLSLCHPSNLVYAKDTKKEQYSDNCDWVNPYVYVHSGEKATRK
ncbi:MAG: hypothetical protein ACFNLL_04635 [Bacteroides sp.]